MSTIRVGTISNAGGTQSTAAENVINGSAKAWVNFNSTGTVAIRADYNVSSITDNGTGDYTVNFTTAMSDANFCAVGTVGNDNTTTTSVRVTSFNSYATGSVRMRTINNNTDDAFDVDIVNVSVFR